MSAIANNSTPNVAGSTASTQPATKSPQDTKIQTAAAKIDLRQHRQRSRECKQPENPLLENRTGSENEKLGRKRSRSKDAINQESEELARKRAKSEDSFDQKTNEEPIRPEDRITRIGHRAIGSAYDPLSGNIPVERDLFGQITHFDGEEVDRNWSGEITHIGGREVEYDWNGNISKIGNEDVTNEGDCVVS